MDDQQINSIVNNTRQYKWLAAYNKYPELAISLLPLFDMEEEDINFIVRILGSMRDGIRFYRSDLMPPQPMKAIKKKKNNVVDAGPIGAVV